MKPKELPYKVICAGDSASQMRQLAKEADEAGTGVDLRGKLDLIQRALGNVPLDWGEAVTDYGEIISCIGFHADLKVLYGVLESRRVVVVRDIRLMARKT